MHFERMDINAYATKLMSDRIFKKMEYKKFVSNCYILQDIGGNIKPDILNAVICKSEILNKGRKIVKWISKKAVMTISIQRAFPTKIFGCFYASPITKDVHI